MDSELIFQELLQTPVLVPLALEDTDGHVPVVCIVCFYRWSH